VDVDLEKFFDCVNHDVLMGRLAKRIEDGRVLVLIRRYLNAGVMAGDTVHEIEGQDTLDMKITDAIKLLKGPSGTDVNIKVRHADGEEAYITITRAKIEVQTVRGFNRDAEHRYNYFMDPVNRIGYIRLTQFSVRTAAETRQVVEQLKQNGMRALVLDLRFNPGGLLEAAVQISDLFLTEGKTIVSVRGRVVSENIFRATADTPLADIPVVVLANPFSASASEIVTGALSDNGRALFVGERTFGKGSVQQFKELESHQGMLKITNAYYYLPSGRNIHRRSKAESEPWGVDPSENAYVAMDAEQRIAMIDARRRNDTIDSANGDGPAEVTPEWIESSLADPQLAAALTALLGKLDTGEWPVVGESNAQALALAAERATLTRQRELLEETLVEVNEKLAKLEKNLGVDHDEEAEGLGEAGGEDAASAVADTSEDAEPAVENVEQVEPALVP